MKKENLYLITFYSNATKIDELYCRESSLKNIKETFIDHYRNDGVVELNIKLIGKVI